MGTMPYWSLYFQPRTRPMALSARGGGLPAPRAVSAILRPALSRQDGLDLTLSSVQRGLHGLGSGQGRLNRRPHRLGDLRVLDSQAERTRVREERLVDIDRPLGAGLR